MSCKRAPHAAYRLFADGPGECALGVEIAAPAAEDHIAAPDLPHIGAAADHADRAGDEIGQRLGHQHVRRQRRERRRLAEGGGDADWHLAPQALMRNRLMTVNSAGRLKLEACARGGAASTACFRARSRRGAARAARRRARSTRGFACPSVGDSEAPTTFSPSQGSSSRTALAPSSVSSSPWRERPQRSVRAPPSPPRSARA